MTASRIERTQQRRRLRQFGVRIAAALVLTVLVWGLVIEPARLVQRDYALQLPHWPTQCDGLRIDVVADTHTGSPHNGLDNLERIVAKLVASDADLVLLAGDYVILSVFMGEYIAPEPIAQRLKFLTAKKAVYGVLGNHDWWKNGPKVSAAFAGAGVRMIDNQALPVQIGACRFWLAGLGDLREGKPDVIGTYAKIPANMPILALTHEPDLFPSIPSHTALTIAGHTHGGQIYPFPYRQPAAFVPHSHTLNGWIEDDGRHLFVSPGIGTSIFPMRLGVPPEISRLVLRSQPIASAE